MKQGSLHIWNEQSREERGVLPLIKFGVEGRKRKRGHLKGENDREIMNEGSGERREG